MKLQIVIAALAALILCVLPAAGEYAAIGDNTTEYPAEYSTDTAGYSAEYWSGQGDQQFLAGSFQEAAESYDKALNLDPLNIYLMINKGKSLANLGRYQDAIVFFDQAFAINSSNAEPLHLKGIALSEGLNRYDESIAVFDQALQLDPSNFDAWTGKGMALAKKGDYTGSLACFQTASGIDPLNPTGWNNEGVILRELGRYQQALERFDNALLLDPNHEAAQKNRNNTLEDLSQIVQVGGNQRAVYAL